MYQVISTEKLTDVQRVVSKLERLPEKALLYVIGYVEGAADTSRQAQAKTAERNLTAAQPPAERPGA